MNAGFEKISGQLVDKNKTRNLRRQLADDLETVRGSASVADDQTDADYILDRFMNGAPSVAGDGPYMFDM
jgi:hypothetical protein